MHTASTSLGVTRAAVPKVMVTYIDLKTSSAERNSGWKPKLSERNRPTLKRIVSKHHRTAAAKVTAELNIHLRTLFPQKQSDERFTYPTSMVELQLLNL